MQPDANSALAQSIGALDAVLDDALPVPSAPTVEGLAAFLTTVLEAPHDGVEANDGWFEELWEHGAEVNNAITASYVQASAELRPLLPGLKTPVWTDFGKFASREAGATYTMLQAVTQFFENLLSPEFWVEGVLSNPMDLLGDARRVAETIFAGVSLPPGMLDQATALIKAAFERSGGIPTDPIQLASFIGTLVGTLKDLGKMLLEGNMRIQANFGPAMAAFTAAEAAGQDGVAAASAVLAGMDPPGDPTGLFAAGLARYQEASRKAKQAERAPTEDERQRLIAEAEALVAQGNVLLAAHEQNLVRDLYESDKAHAVVGALTPTMVIHDPAHPDGYPLLSEGNWADYGSRMGLVPATAADYAASCDPNGYPTDVIKVLNPVTQQIEYWRIQEPPQSGTIPGYFADTGTGADAEALIATAPEPVEMPNIKNYYSLIDLLEDFGEGVMQVGGMVVEGAEVLGGAIGDGLGAAGDLVGGVVSWVNPLD